MFCSVYHFLLLDYNPLKPGVLSVLVTAVSLAPRRMTGTWHMLNNYLLRKQNEGSVSLCKVNGGTVRTRGQKLQGDSISGVIVQLPSVCLKTGEPPVAGHVHGPGAP